MSFAGNLTYKNAEDLREAALGSARTVLLVETDAPFLAPVPHRGHENGRPRWPSQPRSALAAGARRGEDDGQCVPRLTIGHAGDGERGRVRGRRGLGRRGDRPPQARADAAAVRRARAP